MFILFSMQKGFEVKHVITSLQQQFQESKNQNAIYLE